jgi:hypothetical protein
MKLSFTLAIMIGCGLSVLAADEEPKIKKPTQQEKPTNPAEALLKAH